MVSNRTAELIVKKLSGDISEDEVAELNQSCEAWDPKLVEFLMDEERLKAELRFMQEFDSEAAWKKLMEGHPVTTRRINFGKKVKYAVAVWGLLLFTWTLLLPQSYTPVKTPRSIKIVNGEPELDSVIRKLNNGMNAEISCTGDMLTVNICPIAPGRRTDTFVRIIQWRHGDTLTFGKINLSIVPDLHADSFLIINPSRYKEGIMTLEDLQSYQPVPRMHIDTFVGSIQWDLGDTLTLKNILPDEK